MLFWKHFSGRLPKLWYIFLLNEIIYSFIQENFAPLRHMVISNVPCNMVIVLGLRIILHPYYLKYRSTTAENSVLTICHSSYGSTHWSSMSKTNIDILCESFINTTIRWKCFKHLQAFECVYRGSHETSVTSKDLPQFVDRVWTH